MYGWRMDVGRVASDECRCHAHLPREAVMDPRSERVHYYGKMSDGMWSHREAGEAPFGIGRSVINVLCLVLPLGSL